VLPGEINPSGKATGFHAEDAAQGASRITPGADIKQNSNGTYEAPVQLFDDTRKVWVDKSRDSTFFPKDWSEARIKFEASEAFKTVGTKTSFEAPSPSGIWMQFHWDAKNQRTTFYPLKDKPKK
jgi:filamentous hemagglutinin